jgi:hypothetical protein
MNQEVYTVAQFCAAYAISRAKLYQLLVAGTGPHTYKLGKRTMISREAAEAWRRELEAASKPRAAA